MKVDVVLCGDSEMCWCVSGVKVESRSSFKTSIPVVIQEERIEIQIVLVPRVILPKIQMFV